MQVPRGLAMTRAKPLFQGVGEQLRGVQRLQQVVADRRQEVGLGLVGALRGFAGTGQLPGALGHALFQGLVGALELALGGAEGGDVGEGGHVAAAGHRVAADLDGATVGQPTLGQVRRTRAHVFQTAPATRLDIAFADQAGGNVVAHQVEHRTSHLEQAVRVVEQVRIGLVPGHHAQLGVDHADALAHVGQRRRQHALVETQVLRGLAHDRGHGVQILAALVAHHVQQQPGRGRSDDGGQLVIDCGHQRPVRPGPGPGASRNSCWTRDSGRKRAESARSSCIGTPPPDAAGGSRPKRERATSATTARLASRLNTTARPSPLQPDSPNSCCGASQAIPKGPCCTHSRLRHEQRRQQRVQPHQGAHQQAGAYRPCAQLRAVDAPPASPAPVRPARKTRCAPISANASLPASTRL